MRYFKQPIYCKCDYNILKLKWTETGPSTNLSLFLHYYQRCIFNVLLPRSTRFYNIFYCQQCRQRCFFFFFAFATALISQPLFPLFNLFSSFHLSLLPRRPLCIRATPFIDSSLNKHTYVFSTAIHHRDHIAELNGSSIVCV